MYVCYVMQSLFTIVISVYLPNLGVITVDPFCVTQAPDVIVEDGFPKWRRALQGPADLR